MSETRTYGSLFDWATDCMRAYAVLHGRMIAARQMLEDGTIDAPRAVTILREAEVECEAAIAVTNATPMRGATS